MNFETLLRESDPLREISIPTPDLTNARAISSSTDAPRATAMGRARAAAQRRPFAVTISIALSVAVIAVVAVTVLSGGTGLSGPVHTPWRAARALPGSITHGPLPQGPSY
jgi:hypothetical protein